MTRTTEGNKSYLMQIFGQLSASFYMQIIFSDENRLRLDDSYKQTKWWYIYIYMEKKNIH